ncbi:hypothetical protein NMG60_11034701 [Bertholletia excelsa]
MFRAIHFAPQNAAGFGMTDGRSLPCSGLSGRGFSLSPRCSHKEGSSVCKNLQQIKILSIKCTSRGMSSVCKAGSGGYRRNPDFSRQNKHGFSRSRNRQNEERDGSDNLEEPELFSSKNGPLLSMSNSPRFQATATPGPREKEIVELFRKVQAQLRERAAVKEEKKTELSQGHGKEIETVDSLLKLLRKHTSQQEKRSSSNSSSSSSRDFILNQPEQNESFEEEKKISSLDLSQSPFSRPASKFQRRSPIPRVKFQRINYDSVINTPSDSKKERTHPEPKIHESNFDIEPELEPEPDLEPELEPSFPDEDVFDEMSEDEDEPSDVDEGYTDVDAEEKKPIMEEDLSLMKLQELRVLAKSRSVKGFSKLKKQQLVELLSGGSA